MLKRRILSSALSIIISVSMIGCQKEDKIISSVQEGQMTSEDYKEIEKTKEQQTKELKEKTEQELISNSNFINQYNEIMSVYDDYLSFIENRKYGNHYMAENHEKREEEWVDIWEKELREIEIDSTSVLNELRGSIILEIKFDNRDYDYDPISIIKQCVYESSNNK